MNTRQECRALRMMEDAYAEWQASGRDLLALSHELNSAAARAKRTVLDEEKGDAS